MTPLKQRRAAIASVLDLPLDDVPHFGDGGPDGDEFDRRVNGFLDGRGIVPIHVLFRAGDGLELVLSTVGKMNPGVCHLLGGELRTGVDHTVVCLDGKIVHDPALNDSGIIGPCDDGWYWVTFFGSAAARSAPPAKPPTADGEWGHLPGSRAGSTS